MNDKAKNHILYRQVKDSDLPVIMAMYTELNSYFY